MTQKPKDADQIDGEQPPSGIPTKDWAKTPISVQKFVVSILDSNQKRGVRSENYIPTWPTWVMLFVNLVIIVGLTLILANKVVVRCIAPHQVSALSAAFILPMVFHLIWRNVYALIPSNIEETIKLGVVTIPLTFLITFFNEIHPWKISSRLLGFLLIILLGIAAFLNLSANSPFYIIDQLSAIQGFSIQRFDKPLSEGIAVGGTLTLANSEKVLIEAVFRNKAATTCTWYSAMSSQNAKTGCSIVLDEVSKVNRDSLTVLIESTCGTQDFSGLHVIVLP